MSSPHLFSHSPSKPLYHLLTTVTYAMPLLAASLCLCLSLVFYREETVPIVCASEFRDPTDPSPTDSPVEFLPSLSSAVGIKPQRIIWITLILSHSAPSLSVSTLFPCCHPTPLFVLAPQTEKAFSTRASLLPHQVISHRLLLSVQYK